MKLTCDNGSSLRSHFIWFARSLAEDVRLSQELARAVLMRTLASRVRQNVQIGLCCGGALSVVAAIPYLLRSRELYAQLGLSYLQVVAVYFCGGILAGIVSALFWGLTRWIAGAYIVGTLIGMMVYGTAAVAIEKVQSWQEKVTISLLCGACVFGPVAVGLWLDAHPRGSAPQWVNALRYPSRRTVIAWWLAVLLVAPVCWHVGTTVWLGKLRAMLPLAVLLVVTGFAVGSTLVALRGRLSSGSDANAA